MKRTLALLILLALPMFAQDPKPPAAPTATSAQPKTAKPATPPLGQINHVVAPTPTLTELQKTKLENLQLKFTLLQQQQTQLQAEYQALVQTITAEHPGFRWDAQSYSLVAVPEAPKKEK